MVRPTYPLGTKYLDINITRISNQKSIQFTLSLLYEETVLTNNLIYKGQNYMTVPSEPL